MRALQINQQNLSQKPANKCKKGILGIQQEFCCYLFTGTVAQYRNSPWDSFLPVSAPLWYIFTDIFPFYNSVKWDEFCNLSHSRNGYKYQKSGRVFEGVGKLPRYLWKCGKKGCHVTNDSPWHLKDWRCSFDPSFRNPRYLSIWFNGNSKKGWNCY